MMMMVRRNKIKVIPVVLAKRPPKTIEQEGTTSNISSGDLPMPSINKHIDLIIVIIQTPIMTLCFTECTSDRYLKGQQTAKHLLSAIKVKVISTPSPIATCTPKIIQNIIWGLFTPSARIVLYVTPKQQNKEQHRR